VPSLHFLYLAKLYLKNLFALLFGLSLAFAIINYFQYIQKIPDSSSSKILYIFYTWQEALGLLYPLAIIFAVILTKISLVKNNTMVVLHAFGYSKRQLFLPFFVVALLTYLVFTFLHTTQFSYAKDKANFILKNQINMYNINDLFFKYNDSFAYVSKLDPIKKAIHGLTLFKVTDDQVRYTLHAPYAKYQNNEWIAQDAVLKIHEYDDKGQLQRYRVEHKAHFTTLKGYRPKIIESLYEGKALNLLDAYHTWKLLRSQHLNSDKIRAILYDKVIVPLFALAMALILFFKLPYYARMMNLGYVIALSLGVTFVIWGVLFGLGQIGANGVIMPELTTVVPVILLWVYAIYLYINDEKRIQ